jgi:RimJ/RimL family protein N-acetyltransferase
MSREDAWLDFAQMTSTWLLQGHGLWTIGHAGQIAGFVVLGFEPGDAEPELGFMLTATAEGRGLAFEAASAAKRHAFDTLGWSRVVSYIEPSNDRARTLALRLGGVRGGHLDGSDIWHYRAEGQA